MFESAVQWIESIAPLSWFFGLFYLLAIPCAIRAILRSRTPQGSTAWVILLFSFPLVGVPLYFVFGRSRFHGYTLRRRQLDRSARDRIAGFRELEKHLVRPSDELCLVAATTTKDTQPGFTDKNQIELLINGEETFEAMYRDIANAKNYVVVQFYIFRFDEVGKRFVALLMKKKSEGLRVTVLYDEVGAKLPSKIVKQMRAAGIHVSVFNPTRGRGNRLQINFRNHRKIVVVDGHTAFVGGLNVGKEYLGLDPVLRPWRDTHVRLCGPAVLAAQLATAKDWYWAQGQLLDADWNVHTSPGNSEVLVLHSGPADDQETCLLSHLALINAAKHRLWMANPYLVPPEGMVDALILAVLRGVDVRILIPSYGDNQIVFLASRVDEEKLLRHGVKFHKYTAGFSHQKVVLIDDLAAQVGSANLDFRSMFLNFEISVVSSDEHFVASVATMLQNDFALSPEVSIAEFDQQSFWKRIVSRACHLLAPVL